jgi:hypothetical protein
MSAPDAFTEHRPLEVAGAGPALSLLSLPSRCHALLLRSSSRVLGPASSWNPPQLVDAITRATKLHSSRNQRQPQRAHATTSSTNLSVLVHST